MKPKATSQKKAYSELNSRLQEYSDKASMFLDSLNEDVAAVLTTVDVGESVFKFKDHTELNDTVNKVQNAFILGLYGIISKGIDEEWGKAQEQIQKLIKSASSVYDEDIADEKTTAPDAFKKRETGGLTVSQRLWQRYYDYKNFLEASISISIIKGMNAGQIKTALAADLRDTNGLRSRYKDKFGSFPNIKDIRYYVPRLVASEINMAYRESEQQSWRQLDFVLGFKINLSGSHKLKDICDDLAGTYPKTFKWYGWHPLDRCYITPVLMSDTDFWDWNNGGKKQREITDVPQSFKQWVDDNVEKINSTKSPYFFIAGNLDGRLKDYARYKTNSNYKDVAFDYKSGGLKAIHTGHNLDKIGGRYELNVQEAGFVAGHSVILEDERNSSRTNGCNFTEGKWDGVWFEVAGRETATSNNILRGLKHCASKGKTKNAVLDYPNGGYDKDVLMHTIRRYRGLEKLNDGQYLKFDKIICVQNKRIVYYEDF